MRKPARDWAWSSHHPPTCPASLPMGESPAVEICSPQGCLRRGDTEGVPEGRTRQFAPQLPQGHWAPVIRLSQSSAIPGVRSQRLRKGDPMVRVIRRLLIGFVTLVSLLLPQAVLADGMILHWRPISVTSSFVITTSPSMSPTTHATTHVEQSVHQPIPLRGDDAVYLPGTTRRDGHQLSGGGRWRGTGR